MELYKIVFAEFEKFQEDDDYKCCSFGTTSRIYKNEKECVQGMFEEYKYLERTWPTMEDIESDTYEFKVKCSSQNNRKEVLHHYKIVRFNS